MTKLETTIAVIDDNPEMRAAMVSFLSAHGYSVETFYSAEAFLIYASTCRAICLLVDIELGDMELVHQLAADRFKFRFIFMTGRSNAVIEREAVAAGAVAFLCKPCTEAALIDAIKKATE